MPFIETVAMPDGTPMPRLGMGTWYLGERASAREREIAALRAGIDAGVTLIDTAEMYGNGAAEELVGEAIRGYDRERLGTDYLDLYLLHWRGAIPLAETVACMEQLVEDGLIRHRGVSNFDTDDLEELFSVPGGDRCAVNQDLYHLGSRGVEYDVLPWMRAEHMPLMAYCPLAQAGDLRRGLLSDPGVVEVARPRRDADAGAARVRAARPARGGHPAQRGCGPRARERPRPRHRAYGRRPLAAFALVPRSRAPRAARYRVGAPGDMAPPSHVAYMDELWRFCCLGRGNTFYQCFRFCRTPEMHRGCTRLLIGWRSATGFHLPSPVAVFSRQRLRALPAVLSGSISRSKGGRHGRSYR